MPRFPAVARVRALSAVASRALALSAAALLALSPAASAQPGQERWPKAPKEFVALGDVDPTILQEIRYITPHNFTGRPVKGYLQPVCLLTRPAARALHRVQSGLLRRGYSLKVYDCYRPKRAVGSFVAWGRDLSDQRMKGEFYPRVDKSRLFDDGYIAERSGHSRGSTMDLTVVRLPAVPTRPYVPGEPLVPCHAPRWQRFPDNSLDMGTGFDCMDTLSHTLDPRVRGKQRAHRLLLKSSMERAGFVNLPQEWWHYTYQPEPFPDSYFDFPVSYRSVHGR